MLLKGFMIPEHHTVFFPSKLGKCINNDILEVSPSIAWANISKVHEAVDSHSKPRSSAFPRDGVNCFSWDAKDVKKIATGIIKLHFADLPRI